MMGPGGSGSSNDKSRSLKQLSKKLSSLRRKIDQVEMQLKEENGYRQSHQDKLNNSQLKSLLLEQDRLKKEMKAVRENDEDRLQVTTSIKRQQRRSSAESQNIEAIRAKLKEIVEKMEENRVAKNRPYNYQDMEIDQVMDEKMELQSLLRDYEKEFGHPESREEKDCMKEVYERYRIIKRMARRSSQNRSGDSCAVDLMTIPEDEEVDLTLVSPQHRIHLQLPSKNVSSDAQNRHDMDLPQFSTAPGSKAADDNAAGGGGDPFTAVARHSTDNADHNGAGNGSGGGGGDDWSGSGESKLWHAMTAGELIAALKRVREDKKIARRAVKEFEEQFKNTTGRRVKKEDRQPLEQTYKVYKTRKSQVKLINALLAKQQDGGKFSSLHHRSERIER